MRNQLLQNNHLTDFESTTKTKHMHLSSAVKLSNFHVKFSDEIYVALRN